MRFRIQFATALVYTTAVIAIARPSLAQPQSQRSNSAPKAMTPTPQSTGERLPAPTSSYPMGDGSRGQDYFTQGFGDGSGYEGGSSDGYCGCADGYSGGGCCDQSCGDGCCGEACGSGCCNCDGRFFFTADYLFVHPSFSEATAFLRQDLAAGTDTFVPLDFEYNSSYRLGGGYRMSSCGDELRFMFTRMSGDASAVATPTDIVTFAQAPPGGRTDIRADVDANTYDLECVKIIPLGGSGGGCGECCGKSCPAWDVSWSGGVRWADVDWNRSYVARDQTDFPVTDVRSAMTFHGGGIRTGLEGRRYFGCNGWLSLYSKGNLSLLLGDVNIRTSSVLDADPATRFTQTFTNRELIPMFDLEAGLTAQVTCHTAITAGYLFSAWSDLGFRNAFDVCDCGTATVAPQLPTHLDDSNTLGFDGFFARVEFAF